MNNFNKKRLYIIMALVVGVILIGGITYAFFNYSKTSVANSMSSSTIEFDFTDDTLLDVSNDFPQYADLTNEEMVAMKSNHTGSLTVTGHNTLANGVKYSIYVIHGDDITGKQRLADSSIKFQLEPDFTSGENGFTVLTNNYSSPTNLVFDNDGKALISTGLVKDTTELTTVAYNFYMWLDASSMHISSTMKRATLPEGNPSLADTTSGNVTSSRYLKNDGVLVNDVKLFPASSNEDGKIIYTTNEFSNGYYNIKLLVEAEEEKPFTSVSYTSGCYDLTTLSNETVEISMYNSESYFDENEIEHECPTNNIVIPSTIDGRTVTVIDDQAFGFQDLSGTLTLPNNLITIGVNAFSDNNFSGTLVIPNSVKIIDHGAFYSNNFSGTLVLPNGLTTIGEEAFFDNNLSGDLNIPNSVTTIGNRAFVSNSGFNNVTVPNSVANFGYNALGSADDNDTIDTLSIDISTIRSDDFYNMGISSLTLGSHVVNILDNAFRYNQLASITLPSGLTTIGDYAFSDNSLSGNLVIPNTVTTLGYDAFSYNDGFNNVIIPNSVNSFTYETSNNNPIYSLFYDTSISSLSVDITNIPNGLFTGSQIDSLTLGEHVVTIGDNAFSGILASSVTIPNNVTTIGENAFDGYADLYFSKTCSVIENMDNYSWGSSSVYGLNNEECSY